MSFQSGKRTDESGRPGRRIGAWALACACLLAGVVVAGCGSNDPKSAVSEAQLQAALKGAPAPLSKLYEQGGELVGGGKQTLDRDLASVRGYPVVVNRWASWCEPCRAEFPHFQKLSEKYGKKVAFLGVDTQDNDGDAKKFLKEYPVPYPSIKDPDDKIGRSISSTLGLPTTSFYDASGKLVYTKPGGYASVDALEKDLQQYAIAGEKGKQPKTVEPSDLQ